MKLISGLIILFFAVSSVNGQVAKELTSHYLFPEFYTGKILQKSGAVKVMKLNYNSLTEEMVFDNNGKYLALANPETVDTIYIQTRRFIPSEKIFYEVPLNVKVPLMIRHLVDVIPPGKPSGYGGTTQTTAVSNVSNLYSSGTVYEMTLPGDYIIKPYTDFYLKIDNEYRRIGNAKQLLKCFPQKEAEIKEFIKNNKTKFDRESDLIDLVRFCNK